MIASRYCLKPPLYPILTPSLLASCRSFDVRRIRLPTLRSATLGRVSEEYATVIVTVKIRSCQPVRCVNYEPTESKSHPIRSGTAAPTVGSKYLKRDRDALCARPRLLRGLLTSGRLLLATPRSRAFMLLFGSTWEDRKRQLRKGA